MTELQFNRFESIKSVLDRAKISYIDEEVEAYMNECESDLNDQTNVNPLLKICSNAIIQGTIAKYLPEYFKNYLDLIKIVRYHAYDDTDYSKFVSDRLTSIIKQVHFELKKMDTPKIDDQEILGMIDSIQNDILLKTECCEKMFIVEFSANSDTADTDLDTLAFQIRDIVNMKTKDTLSFIPITEWAEVVRMNQYGEPKFLTIFDKSISIAPTPTFETRFCIITYQKTITEPLSNETEPEVPIYADNAIVQGVISKQDPNRLPLYTEQLEQIKKNSNKYVGNQINNSQIEAKWI